MEKNLAIKLHKIASGLGAVQKSAVNPFFNSNYIEINTLIEVLEPELEKNNIGILQPLSTVDGRPAVTTIVTDLTSGESYESAVVMPDIGDPQKMGGAITYFRRYSLLSLFGLRQEDDDGNGSSGAKKPKAKAKKIGAKVAPRSNSRATF